MPFAATLMDLEITILSEECLKEKDKYHMILLLPLWPSLTLQGLTLLSSLGYVEKSWFPLGFLWHQPSGKADRHLIATGVGCKHQLPISLLWCHSNKGWRRREGWFLTVGRYKSRFPTWPRLVAWKKSLFFYGV